MEPYLGVFVSTVLALLGAEWVFAIWINRQFTNFRNLVYSSAEKLQNSILTKLEYHEKHDDQRFASLERSLWEIRVRNAAVDGEKRKDQETFRRTFDTEGTS